jgi:hypothetical protein
MAISLVIADIAIRMGIRRTPTTVTTAQPECGEHFIVFTDSTLTLALVRPHSRLRLLHRLQRTQSTAKWNSQV